MAPLPISAPGGRDGGRERTNPTVGKRKLSLTLDAAAVAELRDRVGARGLSAAVNRAVSAELERLRRAEALASWLAELDVSDGPIDETVVARFEALWLPDR